MLLYPYLMRYLFLAAKFRLSDLNLLLSNMCVIDGDALLLDCGGTTVTDSADAFNWGTLQGLELLQ